MDLSDSLSNPKDDKEKAEAFIALQKAVQSQKMTLKMLGLCFNKCVQTPGESLSSSQQSCIWNCAQRNIETQYFILKRLEGMVKNFEQK
ncbi:hypothetical protein MACK_003740 [Theileria orientalis]|uniref:Mitochondrial import inner membrane translocase subunit n=2 Tax=Theileria orientalis TaxID=68886 RepID=J4C3Q9_THEOR|nr:uncharacterized protein TOT_030000132 [Theileria orientalis strain Shintoku]PVC53435.1 hypothetical protein MACL_00000067 [Theileria orientalis]UVC49631.1 hypothetical protein MACK_003740 [Theileria orientalis]UVC54232.1 hypothetical protein MACJ_003767 [Theileria orientalis]BAM40871.1 uncharacterized protein TOT_030000132 [Theileria orientalis strain Shintoku]|eukprot:XP_009691172.1 uncharacterized protein TOT_030000132 [Theileria orientalis strain Shintoku]